VTKINELSEDTKDILLVWQDKKSRYDHMKLLFGINVPQDDWSTRIHFDYMDARKLLLEMKEPGLASLAKLANQTIAGVEDGCVTDVEVQDEIRRRTNVQQAAEFELLQLSYEIADLFPRFNRRIQ
jgi:hypothetical protein